MSAPDPIAEAREQGAREALDGLRDALRWQYAQMWQKYEWMRQDPAGRDPYDRLADRLFEQTAGINLAIEELHYLRWPGAWDRERERTRKAFERGEV